MAETEEDDKTEEPTQKRMDDALKRGEVVSSMEVTAAFGLLASAAGIAFLSGPIAQAVAAPLRAILEQAASLPTDGRSLLRLGTQVLGSLGLAVAGLFGLLALAPIAARFVQDRPALSAERLKPKLSKLSPMEGFKRVFGAEAFGNFAKALVKVAIVGGAGAFVLWPRDSALMQLSLLDPGALLAYAKDRAELLLWTCVAAAAIIAAADYFFARQAHRKRLRMTKQELKEEFRQSDGDPLVKAKLKQIRQQRARVRMMAQVPKATVVITNPTHYAVALHYERETMAAPVCVAKGVNDVALRIRATAEEHNVPLVEDPPLARALYAAADIDRPIPREHFEAVARIIGQILRIAQRRR